MSSNEPPSRFSPGGAYAFHATGGGLFWDYARAIICIALLGVVLGLTRAWSAGWWVLLVLLVAFGGYLINTIYRHGLRLEMDEAGLTSGWRNPADPMGLILAARKQLAWDRLQTFRIRYFSRQGMSQNGWTMARLVGEGAAGTRLVITFDGDHEGFVPILHAAWATARKNDLMIDEATLANLDLLGISTAEDTS